MIVHTLLVCFAASRHAWRIPSKLPATIGKGHAKISLRSPSFANVDGAANRSAAWPQLQGRVGGRAAVQLLARGGGSGGPRLGAREIRRRLLAFGISPAGIFEKDELLSLLQSRVPEALGPGHVVPLEEVGGQAGSMGAGVQVDATKRFFGLRLDLSGVSAGLASRVVWVLDSAATNSLLTPAAAALLEAKNTGVSATADTATSGRQGGFSQVSVGEATLSGGFSCGQLRPVVMQLPIASGRGDECGLLGLDFFQRFEAVELYLRKTYPFAVFHEKGTDMRVIPNIETLIEIASPAKAPAGLLVATLNLEDGSSGGGQVDAIIDIGSSTTVCNWAAAIAAGFARQGDSRVQLTDNVVAGATGEPVRLTEADAFINFGHDKRRRVRLSIADLPVFGQLGFRGPAMVLGMDCLASKADTGQDGRRIVLSARRGRTWIEN